MRLTLAIVPAALLAGAALLARRFLLRVRVSGDSMLPALHDDDRLLLLRFSPLRRPRRGDVILARSPRVPGQWTVKRVHAVNNGQTFTLLGDNRQHSTDSRVFGDLPAAGVIALAVYRYAPAQRRGRLRAPQVSGSGS